MTFSSHMENINSPLGECLSGCNTTFSSS